MALNAVAEVAVHIGTFRNVDLFHQGLYQLRCRICPGAPPQVSADGTLRGPGGGGWSPSPSDCAVPHLVGVAAAAAAEAAGREGRGANGRSARRAAATSAGAANLGAPAGIVEMEAAFKSQSFLIRYCEEHIELNDTAQFRIERDIHETAPLLLEVRLMFADVVRKTYGSETERGSPRSPSPMSKTAEDSAFKELSCQLFWLHGALEGLHAYCPVVFDEFHFCSVDLMVHASIVDFRLRLRVGPSLSPFLKATRSSDQLTVSRGNSFRDKDEDGVMGFPSFRESFAACGSRRPSEPAQTNGFAPARRRGDAPASLEEALVDLAWHHLLAAESSPASRDGTQRSSRSRQDVPAQLTLAEAVDSLQREYVGRLARTREGLLARRRLLFEAEASPSAAPAPGTSPVPEDGDAAVAQVEEMCPTAAEGAGRPPVFLGGAAAGAPRLFLGAAPSPTPSEAGSAAPSFGGATPRRLAAAQPRAAPPRPPNRGSPRGVEDSLEVVVGRFGVLDGSPGRALAATGLAPISGRLTALLAAQPSPAAPGAAAALAARLLTEDLSAASARCMEAWRSLLLEAEAAPNAVAARLQADWAQAVRRHWGECRFSAVLPTSAVGTPRDREVWAAHARMARAVRRAGEGDQAPHAVEDLSVALPRSVAAVFFDQRYSDDPAEKGPASPREGVFKGYVRGGPAKALPSTAKPRPDGAHVFVLVHGFQGHSFDMRLFKNNIALLCPQAIFLCSTANENDTEVAIEQMGANLAEEVRTFIQDWCPGPPEGGLGRLSFVAHSIGGLVVRSALRHLEDFAEKMYTFVSLSSPHLGYVYAANSLFRTGLWVAKKLRRSRCLEQLSLTDSPDPRDSFICSLSRQKGLEHFQHVVFVSSYQDQYAPYESARVEVPLCAEKDPEFGPVYREMVEALLEGIPHERLLRVDIDFHIPETNLDTMIGRAAHIQFIECQSLQRMFINLYSFLFE